MTGVSGGLNLMVISVGIICFVEKTDILRFKVYADDGTLNKV